MNDISRRPRARHVVFGLVSGIVTALAIFVSPAAANQTLTNALVHPPLSKFCGQTQPGFAPLSRLTARTASFARGAADQAREPGAADTLAEVPASAQGKARANFRATIDVYFHVVYDPAIPASNVSDTAISQQITVMNLGYGGFEGGYDTGFRFTLAGVDRTANAAWFNGQAGSSDERAMKDALHRGDASDLNIYATTAEVYLGWAYFPSNYKTHPQRDGLVIDWESMPGTSTRYAGRYDLGKTATHELGHWFGLGTGGRRRVAQGVA